MQNKRLILAAVAFIVAIAVWVGVYFATRPEPVAGAKTITVTVVHADKSEKTFTCHTDEEYLDKVLLAEKLIEGYDDQYGFVIEKVDGEAAVWDKDNAYWSVFIGEEYATEGISQIPVYDGSTYKLVYEAFTS